MRDSLDLGQRADRFDASTRLLESIVEFDSMAIVTVVLALEDRFNITIDDDEIGAESFETFGTLVQLIDAKVGD